MPLGVGDGYTIARGKVTTVLVWWYTIIILVVQEVHVIPTTKTESCIYLLLNVLSPKKHELTCSSQDTTSLTRRSFVTLLYYT